jgi:hypothetical protein
MNTTQNMNRKQFSLNTGSPQDISTMHEGTPVGIRDVKGNSTPWRFSNQMLVTSTARVPVRMASPQNLHQT